MRTLIVDHERSARAELRRLLAAHPQVRIVGEAADGEEALMLAAEFAPQLCFLNVHLPGLCGLEVASRLSPQCQVIFCTGRDDFAVEAFRLNALDYLLKPIAATRLSHALSRMPAAQGSEQSMLGEQDALLLKFGEAVRLVKVREIERIESVGNHAAMRTPYGTGYVVCSLNRIEKRLNPTVFFRAGRSVILRLEAISMLHQDVGHGLLAELKSGSKVRVSRRAAQMLRRQFERFA
jgi:two-component system, LytTR family, response regulator